MKNLVGLICILVLSFASGSSALIPGLFSTGVKDDGTLLGNAEQDTHYALVASNDPDYSGPQVFTLAPGYPVGPWMSEGPNSRWIAPRPEQAIGNVPGNYKYRITFSLSGFDPSTASIQGQWSTDSTGADILINGLSTGQNNSVGYTTWASFSLTNGFVAGTNTLDFLVRNDPTGRNPTGVRVELSGTALPGTEPAPHLAIDLVEIQAAHYARLTINGAAGRPHRIEYVEKLSPPGQIWNVLTNFILQPNPMQIIDPGSPNSRSRIYRAVKNP